MNPHPVTSMTTQPQGKPPVPFKVDVVKVGKTACCYSDQGVLNIGERLFNP